MKTFIQILTEAATANDMLIGDVLDNWNAREYEAIIERAADLYAQQSNLHKPDVMPSLPDIYSGKLNAKRIKKYKKLAQLYNVDEGTVRDIFCSGADWFKKIAEGNEA